MAINFRNTPIFHYQITIRYSRRSLGETNKTSGADSIYQTMPMLYSGAQDGLLEGPTWGAYWTQNSYGTVSRSTGKNTNPYYAFDPDPPGGCSTTNHAHSHHAHAHAHTVRLMLSSRPRAFTQAMTTLPFLGDLAFKGMKESQNWWFNNMADGTQPYAGGSQGWAPDGCGCDNGEPSGCNYKQGDGDVPIHDWTLEETLSGVVMQAELLLISRNVTAITDFLPLALRTSNLIEGRRDAATGMQQFLSGPSSNLLAPSFGGWTLDNGKHAWSYMTGISVTYSAALMKLVELCKLVGDGTLEALYAARLALNLKGRRNYTFSLALEARIIEKQLLFFDRQAHSYCADVRSILMLTCI